MNLRAKTWRTAYDIREYLARMLEALGLRSHEMGEVDGLESTMEVALPPVSPSDRFRKRLRDDLSLAAQHKVSGLMIEHPRPVREAILLGLASVLTVALAIAVIVFYSRLVASDD